MPSAWIATKSNPRLVEAFQNARWEVEVFAPADLVPVPVSGQVRQPDIMIFEALEGPVLDELLELFRVRYAPMLTIVANWAFAQRARAAGADEVMVAPVDPIELLLRAETLVRASKVVRVGEFRLLACLAEHIGQAVSYDDILQDAFGYFPELGGTLEQVKSCVKRVRMVYRTTELVSVARGGPIQIIQVLVGTLQQILTMEVSRIGTGGAMS